MSAFLALVAAMVAPELSRPTARRFFESFPIEALKEKDSAAAKLIVWSDPTGKIYRCEAQALVGDQKYADYACNRLRDQRTKEPKSPDGQAAYGWFSTVIRYEVMGSENAHVVRDVRDVSGLVKVANLPAGSPAEVNVRLTGFVDANGYITACEGREGDAAAISTIACGRVIGDVLPKITDREGTPVPFVAAFAVTLVNSASATH